MHETERGALHRVSGDKEACDACAKLRCNECFRAGSIGRPFVEDAVIIEQAREFRYIGKNCGKNCEACHSRDSAAFRAARSSGRPTSRQSPAIGEMRNSRPSSSIMSSAEVSSNSLRAEG